jgi:hypothetical protein
MQLLRYLQKNDFFLVQLQVKNSHFSANIPILHEIHLFTETRYQP